MYNETEFVNRVADGIMRAGITILRNRGVANEDIHGQLFCDACKISWGAHSDQFWANLREAYEANVGPGWLEVSFATDCVMMAEDAMVIYDEFSQ